MMHRLIHCELCMYQGLCMIDGTGANGEPKKDVPADVYEAMKISGSKGIFLNTQIKGKYEFEKVNSSG